jgi:hypothetical protein
MARRRTADAENATAKSGALKRPHSSPLMKLPTRPRSRPVGAKRESITCNQGRWRARANQTYDARRAVP